MIPNLDKESLLSLKKIVNGQVELFIFCYHVQWRNLINFKLLKHQISAVDKHI